MKLFNIVDMKRKPTIIDVAKTAGVSKSTVSLVLRNSQSIREKTRLKVVKAMEETGYVYNRAAATLRMSNAGLIGLVIHDLQNPFFAEFAVSLQMALNEKGYATVIANTNDDSKIQDRVVGAMLEHGVSAMIISPAYGDIAATFKTIKRAGVPVLHVLRKLDPDLCVFPFVAPDYIAGGRIACDHLINQGAQKIAFVGGLSNIGVTKERMAGYLEVLERCKMKPIILSGRPTRQFGSQIAKSFFDKTPDCDGAVCFNDLVALGLVNACNKLNRPLKIIGFDDIEEGRYSWPALTTISCNISQLGREIANTVLLWLEEDKEPAAITRSSVELIFRESSKT